MGAEQALEGLRVIDLSHGVAGAYCTKLLADCGARVIKVEPPGGNPLRRRGPFKAGVDDPEQSATFLYLNTNKQGVVLDLRAPSAVEALRRLAQVTDILVEDFRPGTLAEMHLSYDELAALNPRLSLVSLTNFGQYGPYSQYQATHLIHCAMSGWLYMCGDSDREPLQPGGLLSEYAVGLHGAIGAIAAHLGSTTTGLGQHVDVSAQEALDLITNFEPTRQLYSEEIRTRGTQGLRLYDALDGYVGCSPATDAQWQALIALSGISALQDARFSGSGRRQHVAEATPLIAGWIRQHNVQDLVREGQGRRIIFYPVPTIDELLGLDPYVNRGYFKEIVHPVAGPLRYPGAPFRLEATLDQEGYPAPLLGGHNTDILCRELGYDEAELAELAGISHDSTTLAKSGTNPEAPAPRTCRRPELLPLQGIRVLDATWWWAGPTATSMLADLGAEVIKVESIQALDNRRTIAVQKGVTERQWERAAGHNITNRNKLGITLNLKDPRGAGIFLRLTALSDIVAENYSSRVMASFGLDYEALVKAKHDIIMLSMAGFGTTGPWKDYVSHAGATEASSGIQQLTGYPGGVPLPAGAGVCDPLAGLNGAVAALVALEHRRRTGKGQHIDLSQAEACTALIGEEILAYQMTGELPARRGNRDIAMAPHGVYHCRGEDRWVAIAVRSDAEWQSLVEVMDFPTWARDPRFGTAAGRLQHQDEIDARLNDWTSIQTSRAVMRRLQTVGIPAGMVLDGAQLLRDPHLHARGFFEWGERDGDEGFWYPKQPIRLSGADTRARMPAPTMGQHNHEVLEGLLGMRSTELDELTAAGVIGTSPLAPQ